jgi:hypothetical protein
MRRLPPVNKWAKSSQETERPVIHMPKGSEIEACRLMCLDIFTPLSLILYSFIPRCGLVWCVWHGSLSGSVSVGCVLPCVCVCVP